MFKLLFASLFTSQNILSEFIDFAAHRVKNVDKSQIFVDLIDIFILMVAVIFAWRFAKKMRAGKSVLLAAGLLVLMLMVSSVLGLTAVHFVLKYIFDAGLIGAVIIFELKFLEYLNKNGDISIVEWFRGLLFKRTHKVSGENPIDAVCQAVVDLSRTKTGGLIVIENRNKLDDLIHTGVSIDAVVSPYLIRNIFYNGAPLHDGALIIRDGRIFAAGCILPMTHRGDVEQDLGTRHRAAIGMSESSDAVTVVISEESGMISVAYAGEFTRDYSYQSLKSKLTSILRDDSEDEEEKDEDNPISPKGGV